MRITTFPIPVILLTLLLGWPGTVWPTEPERSLSLTQQERAWLAEHPVINIRVSTSYPPFEFLEDGIYKGLAYDYLMLIGERTGLNFRTAPEMPWKGALQSLQDKNGVDLILLITHTQEREASMNFTRDYITFPQVIFTRRNGVFVSGHEDLQGLLLATENDFVEGETLKRDIPQIRLMETETTADALEAVATGQADAYVGNLAVGSYLIDELGLTNLKIAAPTAYVDDSYAMAARKDWPELVSIIEKGMGSLKPADHQNIKQKWFVIPYEHGLNSADIIKWVLLVTLIPIVFIVQLRRMVKIRTRELYASQKLLQAVQDNTSQFSGLLTPDGILLDANRPALDFIGVEKDTVIGKFFWDTPWWQHSSEGRKELKQAIAQAAQGEAIRFESTHISAKGDTINVDFSINPVRNDQGEIIYLVPGGHDITELKELQAKALRTSQLASLGELAAGVAHEVNNPINGGSSQDDKNRDILTRIIKESGRVASIVKGLLAFARDDNVHFEALDLQDLIDETLALNGSQLTKDGISFNFERMEHLPLVQGNAQQLLQLFLNLLSNARYALNDKYRENRSKKILRITVEPLANKFGEFVRVTIFDSGAGLPEGQQDQVMKPFITTKPVGQGTGLGLSICNDIVNNHGGVINIDSRRGEYTKVLIDLPVAAEETNE
jgi:PAS domain S-box-containing protein